MEKVKEGMIVRAKIFESSAQRQKRGPPAVNHRPEITEKHTPAGLNNNNNIIPSSQMQTNGLLHANGTTAPPEELRGELRGELREELAEELAEEPTSTHTDDGGEDEEESVSTDSLSEVSKFESKTTFPRRSWGLFGYIFHKCWEVFQNFDSGHFTLCNSVSVK